MTGLTRRIDEPTAVVAVLSSGDVAPPSRPGPGATLALRSAMARFALPDDHPPRRAAVVGAANAVPLDRVAALAARSTSEHLSAADSAADGSVDAIALAGSVPLVAVAASLGLFPPDDIDARAAILADVETMVAVIGRGAPVTRSADEATVRLLAIAGRAGHDPVPSVSLLYQTLDATAALITTSLVARTAGRGRAAAVPRTVRTALADTTISGTEVRAGDELVVEIGAAGFEFGAGPHECPGRAIAEAIAAAVVGTIESSGFELDDAATDVDADHRPTALHLRRRTEA